MFAARSVSRPDGWVVPAAVIAAGLALSVYSAVLHAVRVPVGGWELAGGALLGVSVGLNVARWGFRRRGEGSREQRTAWALRTLMPPFNLLLGAVAAASVVGMLRAGRNPAGALTLAAWSVVPAGVTLVRLGERLADRVLCDDESAVPAVVAPAGPVAACLPTDGH